MTVLLDTSVLIDMESLDLGAHREDLIVVSAASIGELAFDLDIDDPHVARIREQRFTAVLANVEVIPFGVEEATLYGVLATLVRAGGRNPRPRRLDLQIAATATAFRFPFSRVIRLMSSESAGSWTSYRLRPPRPELLGTHPRRRRSAGWVHRPVVVSGAPECLPHPLGPCWPPWRTGGTCCSRP